VCLRDPDHRRYLIYKENTNTVHLDLSAQPEPIRAIAVDAQKPYAEIDLGLLSPDKQIWKAPNTSDWAIALESEGD